MIKNNINKGRIKDLLPRRWCTTLALKTKVSRATVHNVVTNELEEHPIWAEVISLANLEHERIKNNKKITNKFKNKLSKTT